jgi:hypothetical protein
MDSIDPTNSFAISSSCHKFGKDDEHSRLASVSQEPVTKSSPLIQDITDAGSSREICSSHGSSHKKAGKSHDE